MSKSSINKSMSNFMASTLLALTIFGLGYALVEQHLENEGLRKLLSTEAEEMAAAQELLDEVEANLSDLLMARLIT